MIRHWFSPNSSLFEQTDKKVGMLKRVEHKRNKTWRKCKARLLFLDKKGQTWAEAFVSLSLNAIFMGLAHRIAFLGRLNCDVISESVMG